MLIPENDEIVPDRSSLLEIEPINNSKYSFHQDEGSFVNKSKREPNVELK